MRDPLYLMGGSVYSQSQPSPGPGLPPVEQPIISEFALASMAEGPNVEILQRYLRDTAGNNNLRTTGTKGTVEPPVGKIYQINKLTVYIKDVGAMDMGQYGNNINIATGNGVLLNKRLSGGGAVLLDLLDGGEVIDNADWVSAGALPEAMVQGGGDDQFAFCFDFIKLWGASLFLNSGEELEVEIRHNLSGLVRHNFLVGGTVHDA